MRYAMIMAGGSGTRLWPLSRAGRPKQLLRLFAPGSAPDAPRVSLLELAHARLEGLIEPAHRLVCTAERYRAMIRAQIPALTDEQILGEPVGRDTLNAIGMTAAVLQRRDPDAVFAVLTADHVIEPADRFRSLLDLGFRLVEADPARLVTFSIKPAHASTAYGYVERGGPVGWGAGGNGLVAGAEGLAFRVARFVEKPDLPRAQAYVASGVFGWNSGMFVWRASTILACIERYRPEAHAGLLRIAEAWDTARCAEVLGEVYPTLPRISVDYAVMEPVTRIKPSERPPVSRCAVCTVLMDLSWLDVGSWPAFAQTLARDERGNRAAGGAPVLVESEGNLVVSDDGGRAPADGAPHTIALLGCKDLIVIHTPDATLVMPRAQAEKLKDLHARVGEGLR